MTPSHSSRSSQSREALPKDTAFALLSERRRRFVLHALLREEGVATMREVRTRIERWEDGTDGETIEADLRERQLPKFEAAGVLAYYTASDVVELLSPATDLLPYLELAASDDFRTDTRPNV
ncbi:hypothetical protein SAMN04487950_0317 [Halogranum rubrum]|uniref:DUF7344 domain-containing protein n=1 Tax=Halogranum rubrum TaxID=553466 RepID=A0A1I4B547_9EURY|nr:hypothetical protein [Halogranum rubrum]SFK63844.1 hypothetical protein SAMN04487950_0317 [Halogranum rubrum]